MTFLIASKPAPVNGAAISSGPPRDPGGGRSSAISSAGTRCTPTPLDRDWETKMSKIII